MSLADRADFSSWSPILASPTGEGTAAPRVPSAVPTDGTVNPVLAATGALQRPAPGQSESVDESTAVTRVLVVDDDQDINRLLQARLKARGYEVAEAGDGEQALARLEDVRPDLIFLDVSMPGIGGLEVLERIRAQELDVAVIMTTAFGSEQVAIEALRRGADDYLRKPFERTEFQIVLDRTAARLQLTRQNAALQSQLDEQRDRLEAELARAGVVQAALLPHTYPVLPGFELAARFLPAHVVGGDFYDWQQPTPGVATITLGDVMGKGMPAALLMATVRAAMRAVAHQNAPAAAVELAARALEVDLGWSESFVTLFHAQIDATSGRLTFVDAGHGQGFVRRADGGIEDFRPRGLPLGIPTVEPYQEGAFDLRAGDALVLYSDGLIDAHRGRSLDRQELIRCLEGAASASEMVDCLLGVAALDGPPSDDLTVVVLRATAAG